MPPNPTIVCKECGYVNEQERIYCHGCGTKLDRALLIAQQEPEAVSAEKRHREVKKLMTPGGSFFQQGGRMLVKSVVWAAIVAALIDIALPPAGVPAMPKKGELSDYQQLDMILDRVLADPTERGMTFRETDVNAYLKGKGRFNKVPEWITGIIPLKRAFVNFDDGMGRLTVQGDIAGYPLYVGLSARIRADKTNGLAFDCDGGNIGRLQIPAQVAKYAGAAIPTVLGSFKHERELLLEKVGGIEIAKEQVTLRSKGAASPVSGVTPSAVSTHPSGQ